MSPAAQRWGPRPIDLDIVFYDGQTVTEGQTLVVPHPRWQERDFVKAPLADLCATSLGGSSASSGGSGSSSGRRSPHGGAAQGGSAEEVAAAEHGAASAGSSSDGRRDELAGAGLQRQLQLAASLWGAAGGERQLGTPDLECVLPMGRLGLWPWQRRTQVRCPVNCQSTSLCTPCLGRLLHRVELLPVCRLRCKLGFVACKAKP